MGHWAGRLLVGQHGFPIDERGAGGGSTDRSEDNSSHRECQPNLGSDPPPGGGAQSGLR